MNDMQWYLNNLKRFLLLALGLTIVTGVSYAAKGDAAQTITTEGDAYLFLSAFNDATARGDLDALASLFAPNATHSSPVSRESGRKQIRAKYAATLSKFSQFTFTPMRLVVQGNTAMCECKAVLIQKDTGKRVELVVAVMLTFRSGSIGLLHPLVDRFDEYYDTAAFRGQLK